MSENQSFSEIEREFLVAMFERGKAEVALHAAQKAFNRADSRSKAAFETYLASKGVTVTGA